MESGGEGRVGRKWVWTGRVDGGSLRRGRAAGPAALRAAETGSARLPAGTAGGLRPGTAAFAGRGRSVPQMVCGGRKDCTCGRFFGIIGDGSTERRWRICRL